MPMIKNVRLHKKKEECLQKKISQKSFV
jgi:hypothetical protein